MKQPLNEVLSAAERKIFRLPSRVFFEIHKVFLQAFALHGEESARRSAYRFLSLDPAMSSGKTGDRRENIVILGLTSCEALDIILVAFQRQQVASAVSPAEDGKSF